MNRYIRTQPTVGRRNIHYYVIPGLQPPPTQTASSIMRVISGITGVSVECMQSKTRERRAVYSRQLAMCYLRSHAHLSLKSIGNYLGGRDHATILHGISKISELSDVYPEVRRDIERINEVLN